VQRLVEPAELRPQALAERAERHGINRARPARRDEAVLRVADAEGV
jgi:hypothetical protein